MRHYETFLDLIRDAPLELVTYTMDLASRVNDLADVKTEFYQLLTKNIRDFTGGDILLVEDIEDLEYIEATGEDLHPRSVLRGGTTEAAWVVGPYVLFFVLANNDGGPSYFVPRVLADTLPGVVEAYYRTNGVEPRETIQEL